VAPPPTGNAVGQVLLLTDLEKDAIRRALVAADGVKKRAAKLLGIGVRTLYRKLDEYGIES
jgi:two-component system response regulator AtoC